MSADIFINRGCYIPASGNRNTAGALNEVGTGGHYWSGSPTSNEIYGYILAFNSGDVNPAYNRTRAHGFPIRCVAAFNK